MGCACKGSNLDSEYHPIEEHVEEDYYQKAVKKNYLFIVKEEDSCFEQSYARSGKVSCAQSKRPSYIRPGGGSIERSAICLYLKRD